MTRILWLGAVLMIAAGGDAMADDTMAPAVSERAKLRAWLDGVGAVAAVRVPVSVTVGELHGVKAARVAGPPLDDADPLAVTLDDTRLGISLATRLRTLCPTVGEQCVIWIEGTWNAAPLMPLPTMVGADASPGAPVPFAIHRVDGRLAPGEAPAVTRLTRARLHGQGREKGKTSTGRASPK